SLGRSEDQTRRYAFGSDERRRLDQTGPPDERDQRGAAVRRRFSEPHHDGDPRQGPPAQTAPRSQARRGRLPAADDLRQEGRIPPAGSLGFLPESETARQGIGSP